MTQDGCLGEALTSKEDFDVLGKEDDEDEAGEKNERNLQSAAVSEAVLSP